VAEGLVTGGCQCGAVRYALSQAPGHAHLCHCRMCQKAMGNYFAPWAMVPAAAFALTRGRLATFRSSDYVERGFCRDCGTPLTFRYLEGQDAMSVALGSLDRPELVPPLRSNSIESAMPFFAGLGSLPGRTTAEWSAGHEDEMAGIRATNHQHPDHDTAEWPPHH
jgi:hypothetical protein